MANLRIDNLSGDTITVFFDGKTYTVSEDEKLTVDAVEKGRHTVRVHRTRVPYETEDFYESDHTDIADKIQKQEKSLHTQTDGIFEIDINSSKAVLTVNPEFIAKDKMGMDAIFSGYSLTVSGARIESKKDVFANKKVRKSFILHHVKEAFLPVGGGGILLFFMGLIALSSNFAGKTVNIGGHDFTYPWSIGLTAVGFGFICYSVIVTVNALATAKKYKDISQKNE